ncbi:hypothetical protein D3C71_2182100 [compost metagenome]
MLIHAALGQFQIRILDMRLADIGSEPLGRIDRMLAPDRHIGGVEYNPHNVGPYRFNQPEDFERGDFLMGFHI